MKLLLLFLTTLTLLFSFDTRTHVFISQEIIKDLEDDGKLTIEPFGNFAPPVEVKDAILNHKSTYRMGSIGPDGFPDIASGQVTVHGGLVNGFKSDDWLKWVILHAKTEQEKAFAYGYLAHASSDVFAHTYVNMYTGDVFDADSEHEDVELRHIYLETYISNFLPPMTDFEGKYIGKPHEIVAVSEELPIDYILDTLLLNDTVMQEYKKTKAIYLYYMYDVRNKIFKLDEFINPRDTLYADEVNTLLYDSAKLEVEEQLVNEICDDSLLDIFKDKTYNQLRACAREKEIERELDVIEDTLDNYEDNGATLPRFNFSKLWVARIEHAAREYLKAASRVSQDFLRHDGDSFETMSAWLQCYAKTFSSLGVVISNEATNCLAYNSANNAQNKFTQNISFDLDFSLSLPDLGAKYDSVKDSISDIEGSLASKMIALVTASNKSLIEARDRKVDNALLNQQFSQDTTNKHLLKIPDIAQRLQLEMQLKNGYFDPKRFAPVANAVTFTKLTLLGKDGMNALLRKAGASDLYTDNFTDNGKLYFNILFNAIKTLDANHPWLEVAPPMPREIGYADTVRREYGYKNINGYGFKLFSNEASRNKLFNKIFVGPLNIGLLKPSMILKTPLLEEDYPYVPCISHPFPNGVDDKKCLEKDENITIIVDENTTIIADDETNATQSFLSSAGSLVSFIEYIISEIETLVLKIISNITGTTREVTNDGVTHLKTKKVISKNGFTSTVLSEVSQDREVTAWMIVEDNNSKSTMLTLPTIKNATSLEYFMREDKSIDIKIVTDLPQNAIEF